MSTTKWFLIWVLVVFLAACTAQPTPTLVTPVAPSPTTVMTAMDASTAEAATATPILPTSVETVVERSTATPPPPVALLTNVGELVFVSARFVDQVNGAISLPGRRIRLVIVERPDKARIDLASFGGEGVNVFIQGDDGSKNPAVMAGWVGNEFAIGFQVPNMAKTYTLAWGTNPPVDITAAVE